MPYAQKAIVKRTDFSCSPKFVNNGATSKSQYRQTDKSTTGQEQEAAGYFVQVPLELLQNYDISAAAFKLYVVLKSYARQFDNCWPSHQTLADDMDLKPRRIRDLLKELEAAGLIQIESRSEAGCSNIYHLKKFNTRPARVKENGQNNSAVAHMQGAEFADPSVKNNQPYEPKIAAHPRQNIAYKLHEPEIHEEIHENTHACAEATPDNAITAIRECVEGKPSIAFNRHIPDSLLKEQKPYPEPEGKGESPQKGYESLLNAGLSSQLALRLSRTATANGRTADYIERWIRIARSKNNPAAYLKTVILDNAEPDPTVFRAARFAGASYNSPNYGQAGNSEVLPQPKANPIDFTRYSTQISSSQAEDYCTQFEALASNLAELPLPDCDPWSDEVSGAQKAEAELTPLIQLSDRQNYWLRESLRQMNQNYAYNLRKAELTADGVLRARFYNAAQEPSLSAWLPILQRCCPEVRQVELI